MVLFAVSKAYEPLDPYLDGILRFGGGYSNMLGATGQSDTASFHPEQRNEVFDYVRSYAKAVDAINAASQGTATCVFVPPPQAGLGCKQAPDQSHEFLSESNLIHYGRYTACQADVLILTGNELSVHIPSSQVSMQQRSSQPGSKSSPD